MLLGEEAIDAADARAFDTAQLIDRALHRRPFVKSNAIHLPNHAQAGGRVQGQRCLPEKLVRTGATRLTGGIQPDACFPDPDYQRSRSSGE